jgi:hypothetical protein
MIDMWRRLMTTAEVTHYERVIERQTSTTAFIPATDEASNWFSAKFSDVAL